MNFRFLTLFAILFGISLLFVQMKTNTIFATHTTRGAQYWYGVCKNPIVDAMIVEDCNGLISNHDMYNQGLSPEGWRVAKCVAGGALLIWGGHPELLSYGPVVGCGTNPGNSNNNNPLTPNNNNPVTGLLQGLFGK